MIRIKDLRLEAKLRLSHFARLTDLDREILSIAEKGKSISELLLHAMATALGRELERPLATEDPVAK